MRQSKILTMYERDRIDNICSSVVQLSSSDDHYHYNIMLYPKYEVQGTGDQFWTCEFAANVRISYYHSNILTPKNSFSRPLLGQVQTKPAVS